MLISYVHVSSYFWVKLQRVKVYRLNEDGKWDDQGTGHVTVDYMERSEELGVYVIDEEDKEALLVHRINAEDIYRKQEDTIISWRDPEYSTELALSFQETAGCSYIWDQICSVQRSIRFGTLNNEAYHGINSELRELPAVELSTLPLILKTVVESSISDQIRATELILRDVSSLPIFFRKLMDLFRMCEELDNIDSLHIIYKIIRGIILLNSPQIFEKIFGDELIMEIIGCLEYDPELQHVQHHRSFLKEHVVFKEAIPIKDPIAVSKIHQTYRIGYLKDAILPRALDDATIANINSIIQSNNAMVLSLLKDDSTFTQELFAKLKSPSTSEESKKNLVFFLHEFCNLSKSLPVVQQMRLFRDLVSEGLFDVIADILQSRDKKLALTGTDILVLILNQDPNLLKTYVSRQEGVAFLGLLVTGMLTDFEDDMHCQFLEILRSLLDSYTSAGQRDTIIEIFYEKHLGQLIDVIRLSCAPSITSQSPDRCESPERGKLCQIRTKPEILLNICDLLCFCVLHHPYRIKGNFLLDNVIDNILLLTQRREKYIVVAAVRFFRTLVSRNDEHLMSHIAGNNLLKPIVDAFIRNGSHYNLLHSATLELFEHIRKDIKILLKYLVESFWNELAEFENLSSIQALKVKYDQSMENSGSKASIDKMDTRKRVDERAMEKEEEDYFNEESDEEDSASVSMARSPKEQVQPQLQNGSAANSTSLSPRTGGGLVDYDDDEDDEDYKPPSRKQLPENSDADEGALRLKRKLSSKEEPEPVKKQRIVKNTKTKEGVLAALCSTLSQAVLPIKRASSPMRVISPLADSKKNSTDEEKQIAKESTNHSENCCKTNDDDLDQNGSVSCSETPLSSSSTSDNGQSSSGEEDEGPLVTSTAKMAVNGS
ncbi:serine/threonine-protein phosphatase 4 regulatory subunit 3B-like [Impatiens glandulifera]|uniref:serine/threonine-protein phosphatase 4 regulatory subunit 3B-like n=1 Tax=Impatiens glandulifera TaxID=253017 RepID=UPI001FB109ED|nr:serine/threonine-protein phosphatase 4 regulatory subunit 3B-like [Impatiens glandulifera]